MPHLVPFVLLVVVLVAWVLPRPILRLWPKLPIARPGGPRRRYWVRVRHAHSGAVWTMSFRNRYDALLYAYDQRSRGHTVTLLHQSPSDD